MATTKQTVKKAPFAGKVFNLTSSTESDMLRDSLASDDQVNMSLDSFGQIGSRLSSMDEWSSNDIKRAFRSDGNDGLTDDELKSLANNDVPNGEIHKVPICELQEMYNVLCNYSDIQLLAEVKRRCMYREERNKLVQLKDDLTPKLPSGKKPRSQKKTRPGSPKQERMFEVEEILERRGSSPHVFYRIKWKGYDNPSDYTWEPVENILTSRDLLDMVTEFNMGEMFKNNPYVQVDF